MWTVAKPPFSIIPKHWRIEAMILHQLLSIAARKYAEEPQSRSAAVRMILLNAVRLGVQHLGPGETRDIIEQATSGPKDIAA